MHKILVIQLLQLNDAMVCSNNTRGIILEDNSILLHINNNIDFITIASTGNATDFGDLTQLQLQHGNGIK